MQLTKDQLLGVKPRTVKVPVPEVAPDAYITILQPDGETTAVLGDNDFDANPQTGVLTLRRAGRMARWIIATAVNDDGTKMFTEDDFDAVNALPGTLQSRLFKAAIDLDMTPEEAAKNS